MRKTILFALTLCLLGMYAGAVETLVDGCEDTVYATVAGTGESVTLANSTNASEGSNALEITYNYTAQDAWYKSTSIAKEFATPIDLSEMEFLKVDFNVATGNAAWFIMVYITDANGYVFRAPYAAAFDTSTGGWKTFSAKLSVMDNSQWVASARPANMAKISKLDLRIMNDGNLATAGTLVALMDNVRFVSGTGSIQEVVVEDFESYADVAAADVAWASAFNRATVTTLDTANPYAGAKSYTINTDLNTGKWVNWGRIFTFASPQDWSTVKYVKLGVRGDADLAGYDPTAHLALRDSAGNMAFAFVYGWPTDTDWSTMLLTFNGVGIAEQTATAYTWREFQWDAGGNLDRSTITNMYLLIETQGDGSGFPVDTTIGFDNIVLGYETQEEPIPSDKTYSLGKTDVAPTIDGTMSAGEWDDAGGYTCSGFVSHSNPATAAAEDLEVTVMYDDTYMYFAIQQANSNFSLDFNPTGGGRDPSGTGFGGDDYELFIYPGGTMTNTGYQIVFFPNPVDSICYVWDAAGTLTGFPGSATWNGSGDQAAFNYAGGILTIEYRIPWTAFNLAGATVGTVPANGTKWGLQIGHINNNPSEAVNWEADDTAGFAAGLPNGEITFTGGPITSVSEWNRY